MLTATDRALRLTGVGASEAAAVLELNPYKGPLYVWCCKPTPSRRPLIVEDEYDETVQAIVGHALEDALRGLFTKRTGISCAPGRGTIRHPARPHVLATPDGLGDDIGAEIKVVGSRMAHHWANDSFPDYVRIQAVQGMAVTGFSQWAIVALVGGTDLRVHTLDRDLEVEELVLDAIERFWRDYVEADVVPKEQSPEERRMYLRKRYPGSDKSKCREQEDAANLAATFAALDESIEELEQKQATVENALIELVANDYGIQGTWGKFLHYTCRGRVDWKAVAEELAGGAVSAGLVEKHRGESYRVPRYVPPKEQG